MTMQFLLLNSSFKKNLSWIFWGNTIYTLLHFALNIVCARAFGADNYGTINYSAALIAFCSSVSSLGLYGVITKFFAEDEKNAGEIIGTGILARLFASIVSICLLQVILIVFRDSNSQIRLVVFCQSLSIVFSSFDLYIFWFRYRNEAKFVAIFRLIAFFFSAIWQLISIFVFKRVFLYVLGISFETFLFSIFLVLLFKMIYSNYPVRFNIKRLNELLKSSYPFITASLLIVIYAQTDKIMLKNMLDDESVGLYSVCITLAGAASIIPTTLIEGFRPEIMSFRIKSIQDYHKRMQQLYGLIFWICISYCFFIMIFSRQIILLLYGESYMGAVPALSIIVWYTTFSFWGAVNNLYFVAENKTKWIQFLTLFGGLTNIILNIILIPAFGIIGASIASLATQFLVNFFLLVLIPQLRPSIRLMFEGIALKGFKDFKAIYFFH